MKKVVILDEDEYNDLVKRAESNKNEDIELLKACTVSLYAFDVPTRICPKCRKAMLVKGYVCPECGYDDSDSGYEDECDL